MIKAKHFPIVTVIVCLALAACDAFQIPTPAPTDVPTPSGMPSSEPSGQPSPTSGATDTPSPLPTASPVPTDSPSPTPSPTPIPTPTPTTAAGWSGPQLVDASVAAYVSMGVDAEGHNHIAASDYNSVYYLTDAGGTWARTSLSQAPAGGADIEPAIAIAPDGTLAVAFTRWSIWSGCAGCPSLGEIEGVYFASNAGDGWSEPRQVPGFGQRPALTFWNDSWSVIQEQHDGLFWLRKDGLDWPDRKIGDEDASDAQIGVDADGVAHVVYDTPANLVHVTRNGKLEDRPVPGTSSAEQPRMAVDSAGAVELVYTGGVGQILQRVLEGDEWSDPQQLDVVGADSFDVDAGGNLHFMYLRQDAGAGVADVVYSSIKAGQSNSVELGAITFASDQPAGAATMVVDDQGRPHVVYATAGQAGVGAGTFVTVGPAL